MSPSFNAQFGARLLNRLSFRTKLMVLPLLAAAGFVVVLVVSTTFAMRNQNLLTRVETGYYPAVEPMLDGHDFPDALAILSIAPIQSSVAAFL